VRVLVGNCAGTLANFFRRPWLNWAWRARDHFLTSAGTLFGSPLGIFQQRSQIAAVAG